MELTRMEMEVKAELERRGYVVNVTEATKGGIKVNGFAIGTGNVRPTVYASGYSGYTIEEIVDNMEEQLKMATETQSSIGDIQELIKVFDNVKDKLRLCVRPVVDDRIFTLDYIGVQAYVRVAIDTYKDGLMSFSVTKEMMNMWGIDGKTLFNAAIECTYPLYTITNIMDIISEFHDEIDLDEFDIDMESELPMYVISTKDRMHGASALFNTSALKTLAEKFDDDVYIIPSSIHECLVIPYSSMEFEHLKGMVEFVNNTEVRPDEVLSYDVFKYSRETEVVTIAE